MFQGRWGNGAPKLSKDVLSRPLSLTDLKSILAWRNRKEVRRNMFTQREIGEKEHYEWFAQVSADPNRHPFIFEQGGSPVGFFNLSVLVGGNVADWGFYLSSDAPKGTGKKMGAEAIRIGFEVLGLRKVCGQVIEFNRRSRKMHEDLGFNVEGRLIDQFFDGNHFHTVVLYGLLNGNFDSTSGNAKR